MKKIVLSVFLLGVSYLLFAQWELQMPKPTNASLSGVAQFSPNAVFFTGYHGTVLKTTDQGQTFSKVDLNTTENLPFVTHIAGTNTGWIAGDSGSVFITEDLGESWKRVKEPDTSSYSSFFALDEKTAWVSESKGGLSSTDDGGATWQKFETGVNYVFRSFSFFDKSSGFAIIKGNRYAPFVSDDTLLLKTSDGGNSWDTVAGGRNDEIFLLQTYGDSSVWYARDTLLYFSDNRGETWQTVELPVINDIINTASLAALSKEKFWILIHSRFDWATVSSVYYTENGGKNWVEQYNIGYDPVFPRLDNGILYNITVGENAFYAVGGFGRIVYHENSSNDWQTKSHHIIGKLYNLSFVDKNTGYGVGYGPGITKTNDGGKTWDYIESLPFINNYEVWFTNKTTGFVVNDGHGVFKTTDGGANWNQVLTYGDQYFTDIQFVDETTGWVLKDSGEVFKTVDNGETWNLISTLQPEDDGWWELLFNDVNTGFAASAKGSIEKTTDGGLTWKEVFSNTEVSFYSLCSSDKNTFWASAANGIICKSDDGGNSWQITDTLGNGAHPVSKIYFITPDIGYALCSIYGLYVTTDGGNTWSVDESFPLKESMFDLNGIASAGNNLWIANEKEIVRTTVEGVGINKPESSTTGNLVISPDPVTDYLTITSPDKINTVTLFSINGQQILNSTADNYTLIRDIRFLQPGVYIVIVKTKKGVLAAKFVKE